MSILIKGMQMPKNCRECRFLEGDTMDGLCHAANKWLDDESFLWHYYAEGDIDDSMPFNCPLIELPPHGDLIDRGMLKISLIGEKYGTSFPSVFNQIITVVNSAPTIIESEE